MSLIRVISMAADLLDKTSGMRIGAAWHDPALDQALPRVKAGRLPSGLELIKQARGDNELRALRVDLLATAAAGHTGALSRLAQDDADALLWLGAARIKQAWAIRGGSYAKYVGAKRFLSFWDVLAQAEEPLRQAAKEFPDDPVPWDRLQWHALGMQAGRDELDGIWAELTARDPHLYAGHYSRAQTLCAKWGGSHQEVLDFARDSAAVAPPGDPISAMPALAHFEIAWSEDHDSERPTQEVLESYFGDSVVSAELSRAADAWRGRPRPHPRSPDAAHLFGAAFYFGGHLRRAQGLLAEAGKRMPEILPWAAASLTPGRRYARARRDLGLT
ncbi:hypothetical protein HII36_18140 [Nonomuraea sp. NN258]|uniref:hypothetical protein n=1 Tax=Nonomuraea antri TaxID=2730852 RepID=UPI00156881FD|nr:hypothetical protein [Nonomuraea antri]NRQ33757.1 hypothetical protein [Nonomuraea antri]